MIKRLKKILEFCERREWVATLKKAKCAAAICVYEDAFEYHKNVNEGQSAYLIL